MGWSRFFPEAFLDSRGGLVRRMVILTLMAVILYQLTGIFYKGLALRLVPIGRAPAEETVPSPAAMALREQVESYRVIAERNLFGTVARQANEPPATAIQPQPDLSQQIDLRGTVAGGASYGFAIIEELRTRKQRLIRVGDRLAGATVVRIRRNAVDLLIDGQTILLAMQTQKKKPTPLPPPAALATVPAVPSAPRVVSRGTVQEAMSNIGAILSQALVRPHFSAGVPDGFIINSIRPGSLYQKMGIANGDVIQEVNNRKIRTVADVMGLLNTIRSGATLSLGIRRREKPETLNYRFE